MLRIIINNQEVEILNEFDLGLVLDKRAVDVSQPFARLGSRSYTITLPATDRNNEIFNNGNAKFTINKFGDFDCVCYDGETELIKGTFRLQKITRTTYEGFIYSQDIGFADIIEGKSIQELDLGSIRFVGHKKDDEINGVTLTDTWDSDFEYFQNAWFALISYGNFFSLDARDRFGKIDELTFTDFTPNHQLKTVFRKIFEEAGYSVSGEIVDSPDLEDIMLTFSGDKVPWNWELLTKVIIGNTQVFNTNNIDAGVFGTNPNPLISNKRRYFLQDVTETKDHLSKYDNSNVTSGTFPVGQEWVCPREGTYEFNISMQTVQALIGDGLDDANALEQAKHNKIVVLNADNGDTSDEDSPLFTSTTTPYANTNTPSGEVEYSKITDVVLGVGESTIIKYDNSLGGSLDGEYNPATGEYTALNNEVIQVDLLINSPDINLIFTPLINGVPANIDTQDLSYNNQGQPSLIPPNTGYFATFQHPNFDYIGLNATEIQLQAGDILSFELKNNGNAPVTTLSTQFDDLLITVSSLVDRPVPIFEISDLVKAYVEPWKSNTETAEEKTGGAVSSDYERISISYTNSGYTQNAVGNYSYITDIDYTFKVKCDRGEIVKFALLTYNDNANYQYEVNTVNNFEFVIRDGSGELFNFASALPNISQKDFATDVIQTFNIYPLIDETNKSISFVKRADYFKRSNPVKLDYSLHERTFTPSQTPRTIFLGLNQVDDDYSDELEGLRQLSPNPNAPNDNTVTFASKYLAQAYPRLYTIQGNPTDSAQFEIPSISINGAREVLRADVGEWSMNTPQRLVQRGDGTGYKLALQSLNTQGVLIDEILFNVLPISKVSGFTSFLDGNTIFGSYWSDIYLYQSAEDLQIVVAMTAEQFNEIDLRRGLEIEGNTYTVQGVYGFNPLRSGSTRIKLT